MSTCMQGAGLWVGPSWLLLGWPFELATKGRPVIDLISECAVAAYDCRPCAALQAVSSLMKEGEEAHRKEYRTVRVLALRWQSAALVTQRANALPWSRAVQLPRRMPVASARMQVHPLLHACAHNGALSACRYSCSRGP